MNTKLIGALVALLLVWGGYKIVAYYKHVEQQRWLKEEEAAGKNVDPGKLDGVPYQLQSSLTRAEAGGAESMKNWLQLYGNQISDPRKAWIQLDYCKLVARDNPQEARALFAAVKQRLTEDSPVYPRMKQLEKSFE